MTPSKLGAFGGFFVFENLSIFVADHFYLLIIGIFILVSVLIIASIVKLQKQAKIPNQQVNLLEQSYKKLKISQEQLNEKYKLIEEQKDALRNSRERYRLASEGAEVGIWDYDFSSGEIYLSTKGKQIAGIGKEQKNLTLDFLESLLVSADVLPVTHAIIQHLSKKTDSVEVHCRLKLVENQFIWLSIRGRALFDEAGNPIRIAGSINNIDKEKIAEEKVMELAYYDLLTKLPNRYYFQERIAQIIRDSDCNSFALMFIDVDNLRAINDSIGYEQGDFVLKKITEILEQYTDEDKELFKFGGDEFIILSKNIESKESIEVYLSQLMGHFQKPFDIDGLGFSITLSIGVAIYPIDGEKEDVLMKHADTALNHIKQKGKNGYEIFSFELNRDLNERLTLERELRKAIDLQEMILYYQPKIDLITKQVVGYEALLRWAHPEKGLVSPMTFIPLAEETGLIIPLGEWVIREAVSQLEQWHQAGHDELTISINLSAKQLKEIHLVEFIGNILKNSTINPAHLELEITETAALYDINYAIMILGELKKLGLKVSLDDFGTGYSSLNYLTALPIDTLKIDKSFLANNNEKQNIEIIKSVIALAHACDMNVVAEGVETKEQLEFLKLHQCDLIQGFYFSKPLPHIEAIGMKGQYRD